MAEFDAYADSYEKSLGAALAISGESGDFFARGRASFLRATLEQLGVSRSASILDFGCGVGAEVQFLRDVFAPDHLVGVDVSADSLAIARRRQPTAEFCLPDDYTPAQDVDLVYCNGVFHHIPPTDRPAALWFIRRALRPGGFLALWENNPWNPGTRYAMSRCEFDRDAIPVSARAAVRLVQAAGLRVVCVRFAFIFPRWLQRLRWTEAYLTRLPLGAQYQVLARMPSHS